MRAQWTEAHELTVDVSPRRRLVTFVAALIAEVLLCLGAGVASFVFAQGGVVGLVAGLVVAAVVAGVFALVIRPGARFPIARRERAALVMGLAVFVGAALVGQGMGALGALVSLSALILGANASLRP